MAEAIPSKEISQLERESLKLAGDRSSSSVIDSGGFILENGLNPDNDLYSQFWDASVFLIRRKNPAEEIVQRLARLNKKLPKELKFDADTLSDIKKLGYAYFDALHRLEGLTGDEPNIPDKITQRSKELLESGNLYKEFMRVFSQFHVADARIAEVILIGYLVQNLHDPDVIIQPVLDGEKGSGKSSGVAAALYLLPPEYVYEKAFSPKSLYFNSIPDKSVLYIDDDEWNPDLGAAVKRYMNDVTKGTEYDSLDQNRNPITGKFPKKCMFITSCVGDSGNDQLLDRQFRITVNKDPDKQKNHQAMVIKELTTGQNRRLIITEDVEVIRQALREFRKYEFCVVIPEAEEHLKFISGAGMRDIESFKAFLRGAVILKFKQRKTEINGNILTVWSEEEAFKEDLSFADAVFTMNPEQRKLRLNGFEQSVYAKIKEICNIDGHVTIRQLVNATGKNQSTVHRAIFGRDNVGGLVSKVGGLHVQDETFTSDGTSTKRKVVTIPGETWVGTGVEGNFALYQ